MNGYAEFISEECDLGASLRAEMSPGAGAHRRERSSLLRHTSNHRLRILNVDYKCRTMSCGHPLQGLNVCRSCFRLTPGPSAGATSGLTP